MKYFGTFNSGDMATDIANIQAALDDGTLGKPYVARYAETGGTWSIDWNGLGPKEPPLGEWASGTVGDSGSPHSFQIENLDPAQYVYPVRIGRMTNALNHGSLQPIYGDIYLLSPVDNGEVEAWELLFCETSGSPLMSNTSHEGITTISLGPGTPSTELTEYATSSYEGSRLTVGWNGVDTITFAISGDDGTNTPALSLDTVDPDPGLRMGIWVSGENGDESTPNLEWRFTVGFDGQYWSTSADPVRIGTIHGMSYWDEQAYEYLAPQDWDIYFYPEDEGWPYDCDWKMWEQAWTVKFVPREEGEAFEGFFAGPGGMESPEFFPETGGARLKIQSQTLEWYLDDGYKASWMQLLFRLEENYTNTGLISGESPALPKILGEWSLDGGVYFRFDEDESGEWGVPKLLGTFMNVEYNGGYYNADLHMSYDDVQEAYTMSLTLGANTLDHTFEQGEDEWTMPVYPAGHSTPLVITYDYNGSFAFDFDGYIRTYAVEDPSA